jgi:NAD-dependent dihydropyrimidine dehydrogenase PreA subunit
MCDKIYKKQLLIYIDNKIYLYTTGGVLMAYKISDECISCGACADGCPVMLFQATVSMLLCCYMY